MKSCSLHCMDSDTDGKHEVRPMPDVEWTHLEAASRTWGSCSHRLRASTHLVLRWGRDSMKIASAHNTPALGHSCRADTDRDTGLVQTDTTDTARTNTCLDESNSTAEDVV